MKLSKMMLSLVCLVGSITVRADVPGALFTLKGKYGKVVQKECFLYVDRTGVDESSPGSHKAFAEVRTSFFPTKKVLIVDSGRLNSKASRMTSLDEHGLPSKELMVVVPFLPTPGFSLYGAKLFHSWGWGFDGDAGRNVTCHSLSLVSTP